MKNFFRYYRFYQQATGGKIHLFVFLSLFSALSEALAAASIVTAINFGMGSGDSNLVTRHILRLLNRLGVESDSTIWLLLLSITAAAFMVKGLTMLFEEWYKARIQGSLYISLQQELLEQIFKADFQTFLEYKLGELNNILIAQLRMVAQSFGLIVTVISAVLFTLIFLNLPLIMNPHIALTTAVLGGPFIFLLRHISHRLRQISVSNAKTNGEMNSLVIQILTHYRYLKATNCYPCLNPKLEKIGRHVRNMIVKLAIWGGVMPNIMTPVMVTFICLLTYWQVSVQKVPILDACAVLGLLYYAVQKAIKIPSSYQKFLASSGSIDVYREFKDKLSSHPESVSVGAEPDFEGAIEFRKVSFAYRINGIPVLRDVSLEIPHNAFVGFAGESGSGKSTVLNMITGLLSPTEGELTLNGKSFNELDLARLRQSIGYVSQDAVVFNDSVKSNISMWDPGTDAERVKNAAQQSFAAEFIEKMDRQYSSLLGDNGINISGGQRQRIAIARELYKDSPILILDEATSALDSETENLIQQSLLACRGSKTIIAVAHRLSTLRECDTIFVMDEGRIIGQGPYQELYHNCPKFKDMVDRQNLTI